MAHNYSQGRNNKVTKQTQAIPGRESEMAQNSAGGFSFILDKWKMLDRFLILGSEGGTYYISEKDLTKQNVENCIACIKEDSKRVLDRVVEISEGGRAPKNDQAIFLMALLLTHCKDAEIKRMISDAVPRVCRIGTHLFTFAHYVTDMRGWGQSVMRSVENWYAMDPKRLEMQIVKYQGRTVEGTNNKWTHKDVIRRGHPKPISDVHNALLRYSIYGDYDREQFALIAAYEDLVKLGTKDVKKSIKLISDHKIPHDAWPTELKNEKEVWASALPDLPLTATIRNLNKLTELGILAQGHFDELKIVEKKLTDQEFIKKSRVHPMNVLVAMRTYQRGQGVRGGKSWKPVQKVTDMLEEAFYLSFGNVEPTGKRMLLALDISGSMSSYMPSAQGVLMCCEASACMAMVTARVEKDYEIMGFSTNFKSLNISPKQSLDEVIRKVKDQNFGGTDCSLPMTWAMKNKLDFDSFAVYTDSETWAGRIQPSQALKQYRGKHVNDARLVVVGMTSNGFSIADPKDPGMLDVVGFDTTTPQVISEFTRGTI